MLITLQVFDFVIFTNGVKIFCLSDFVNKGK